METNTPREVTVNADQRLYVIPCGDDGYSCLGFDVAERKGRAVLAWLDLRKYSALQALGTIPELFEKPGTMEHYRQYEAIMNAGRIYNLKTGSRCDADLTPELTGLEQQRVEVTFPNGEKNRFYVGKSTGWMPCHLEIKRVNSSGGGAVYFPKGATVRVVGSKTRR